MKGSMSSTGALSLAAALVDAANSATFGIGGPVTVEVLPNGGIAVSGKPVAHLRIEDEEV